MVSILNYGLGNINAFINIFKSNSVNYRIVQNKEDLMASEKLIIPGVGAFDTAMEMLKNKSFISTLNYLAKDKKIPILGICVGMQIMATRSEEGLKQGFGWIDAEVKKFKFSKESFPIPHMGWNELENVKTNKLTKGLDNEKFYFLHSYFFHCSKNEDIISETDYGKKFSSVVCNDNIFGVQFHPEKSHDQGTKLLLNFSNL